MEKVKVLHCLHSLSWGGLEIYTVELIQKLAENSNFEHAVLCAPGSRVFEELQKTSIKIHTFDAKKTSKLSHALLIRKLLKDSGYSYLHSHSRLDMWACSLSLIGNSNVKHLYNLYMNATPKKDFFHRWLFSRIHAICSSSEVILMQAEKNFPIDPQRLHLIRYGRTLLSPSELHAQQIRNHQNTRPEQIVFGTLCRIDPGKGVRELIESLHYLSIEEREQIQLWIVGDPTTIGKSASGQVIYEKEADELNYWIQETVLKSSLAKNIRRISFQKDFADTLQAFDVFALASYNETYSLAVLDAMLLGKPVIATNSGGSPEQVGANERGLLAEPKDAASIAVCLQHYIKHRDDIFRQGRLAQEWALKNHSWQRTIRAFEDLYLHQQT